MKYMNVGSADIQASQVVLGCMRMNEKTVDESQTILETAFNHGINFFDHADIYGGGKSEELFGQALKNSDIKRDEIFIQSKAGIRKGMFDFSKEHLIKAVDGSLERLQTDYLDFLLLHRPDALYEPEEIAETFDLLKSQGKVRYFGVSNQNPSQIELLKKYLNVPITANQLQFGPAHTGMVDAGFNVNMLNDLGINRDGGILDYCRLHNITIQPWSPFQVDLGQGLFIKHPDYKELTQTLNEMADEKRVTLEALTIAWINRHPAKMQPIIGTMNLDRIKAIAEGADLELTRDEWYKIYLSAGNTLP